MPAQNGLPTPPEQHLPHPGIRTLQPDFSRDATPQTPPEDPSPGHPASAGTNPPGNRVHQTAEESFHSRATCENPGTYCRIGFSYKSLRQGPPRAPSPRARRHIIAYREAVALVQAQDAVNLAWDTGALGSSRCSQLRRRKSTRRAGSTRPCGAALRRPQSGKHGGWPYSVFSHRWAG